MERREQKQSLPPHIDRLHGIYSAFRDTNSTICMKSIDAIETAGIEEGRQIVEAHIPLIKKRLENLKNALEKTYGKKLPEYMVVHEISQDEKKGIYFLPHDNTRIVETPVKQTAVFKKWKPDFMQARELEGGDYFRQSSSVATQMVLNYAKANDVIEILFGHNMQPLFTRKSK